MKVTETSLPEVLLIEPDIFRDDRGYFYETYRFDRYRPAGIAAPFVQDNVSFSQRGVLRGLHLQHPHPQGKLVYALEGEVLDVAVDVRPGSPSYGRWVGALLSAAEGRQIYIPEGFAHGFCVISESALVCYKCTEIYHPESEIAIVWNDPDLGIRWPTDRPTVSPKDERAPRLAEIDPGRLPRYGGDRR